MPISIGALVSIFFTFDAECVVTLSMKVFSSAMSNSSRWCHEIDSSANSQASIFHCQNLLFISSFPKPSFVLVRLVDEVPEDVIKLLHVFCTVTFADVADQRCIR